MSHTAKLLKALKRGEKITKLGALKRWGFINTGARISELRARGHDITTTMITRNGKRYARYSLDAD